MTDQVFKQIGLSPKYQPLGCQHLYSQKVEKRGIKRVHEALKEIDDKQSPGC
jgi:hypothetical protein